MDRTVGRLGALGRLVRKQWLGMLHVPLLGRSKHLEYQSRRLHDEPPEGGLGPSKSHPRVLRKRGTSILALGRPDVGMMRQSRM